ncbi:uncharacterized protein EDB91DRAFT_1239467 [Suillus paluster]|uniref:uncharacterized protein n=1 Tax=Suillus paluster TaxID=48578 RepID=UPI001B8736A2|nr:uncharacterized protein EDB91DRAFT_1239467 [Suillus paluster]KAG1727964.1 hypothetical protein EDB91DRAFT_1239467 [Suillus paluster]
MHFCTVCWISIYDKDKPKAFEKGGEEYRNLTTPNARKIFVKEHATCYTQLSRLLYFNLVEQIVVDPMHNLFLGLVKTHFYNIWVQSKILRPNHELEVLHEMLADFVVPGSCGKLPTDIGMPSGGSLTADQWLLLSTVYGPVIPFIAQVPQLWSKCLPTDADQEILNQRAEKFLQATLKADEKNALVEAKKKGKDAYAAEKARIMNEKAEVAEAKRVAKLHAAAAKQAEKLYGSSVSKPNHHYATHVADCTHNFGSLNNFWMFLFERLNKVLKSFKTNNHADGELETTFFREFQRTCQTGRLVS